MTDNYEDIIHLPHHISKTRPQMTLIERAAQFAPFSALTGYDDAVKETARFTSEKLELDDSAISRLNEKLQLAIRKIKDEPVITITFFVPDKKKDGGSYIDVTGVIKNIDEYERKIIFKDNTKIPIDEIYNIDGEIYKDLY